MNRHPRELEKLKNVKPHIVFCEAAASDCIRNGVSNSIWEEDGGFKTYHPYIDAFGPPDVPLLFVTQCMQGTQAVALIASWIRTHTAMYPNTPKTYHVACVPFIPPGFSRQFTRVTGLTLRDTKEPRASSAEITSLKLWFTPLDAGVYTLRRHAYNGATALYQQPSHKDISSLVEALQDYQEKEPY